jgi:hypothetical protein
MPPGQASVNARATDLCLQSIFIAGHCSAGGALDFYLLVSLGCAGVVYLPSRRTLSLLVALPLAVWAAALGAGMAAFDGIPEDKRSVRHAMTWFDTHVFRTLAGEGWGGPMRHSSWFAEGAGVRHSCCSSSVLKLASAIARQQPVTLCFCSASAPFAQVQHCRLSFWHCAL